MAYYSSDLGVHFCTGADYRTRDRVAAQENGPCHFIDRRIGLWRNRKITPEVVAKLEANSPLGKVLAAGLRNDRTSREGAMQQIEAAGAVVANRLTKNLTLLGSIGSIAPLLGLLGTVVGMIAIFASQQAGSNPQDLARGISVALYCTALGIIVAVPAVLAYRYFKRLVDDYLVDMEEQAERLLETVFATPRSERAERA